MTTQEWRLRIAQDQLLAATRRHDWEARFFWKDTILHITRRMASPSLLAVRHD